MVFDGSTSDTFYIRSGVKHGCCGSYLFLLPMMQQLLNTLRMSYKNSSIALALLARTSVFLSSNGARCHHYTWHQNLWPVAWSCSWFNRPPLLYPTNGLSLDSELNKRISGMHSIYSGLLQTPFLFDIHLRKMFYPALNLLRSVLYHLFYCWINCPFMSPRQFWIPRSEFRIPANEFWIPC